MMKINQFEYDNMFKNQYTPKPQIYKINHNYAHSNKVKEHITETKKNIEINNNDEEVKVIEQNQNIDEVINNTSLSLFEKNEISKSINKEIDITPKSFFRRKK